MTKSTKAPRTSSGEAFLEEAGLDELIVLITRFDVSFPEPAANSGGVAEALWALRQS
jgi:hypothetical protein